VSLVAVRQYLLCFTKGSLVLILILCEHSRLEFYYYISKYFNEFIIIFEKKGLVYATQRGDGSQKQVVVRQSRLSTLFSF
jgi:hypothetical protein